MTDAASGAHAEGERGVRWAARASYLGAGLVVVVGGLFPFVAEAVRPGALVADAASVLRGAGWAAGPAAVLVWSVARAGGRPGATGAALVGTLLVVGLGLALYASALRAGARPSAPALALTFVPVRQLVAAAFVGWAVWLARRSR